MDAQRTITNQPIQISQNDFKGRRKVFEQMFIKLEDEEAPAKSYLETLDTRIGDGEFKAERLIEVFTEDEDIDDGAPISPLTASRELSRQSRRRRSGRCHRTRRAPEDSQHTGLRLVLHAHLAPK